MKKVTIGLLATFLITFAFLKPLIPLSAISPNQINVLNSLLSVVNPTPTQLAVLTAIALDLDTALIGISGDQYSSLIQLNEFSNRRFLRELYAPLSYDAEDLLTICPNEVGYESWAEVGGGRAFLRGDGSSGGFKMHNYDVTLGVQKYFDRNLTAGAAVNYEFDHVHFYTPGDGSMHTVQAAFYAMYNLPCFYLMTDFIGGWTNSNMTRLIQFGTTNLTAQSTLQMINGLFYFEGGANMHSGIFLVRPFVGIETGYYFRPSISETGAGNFGLVIPSETTNAQNDSRAGVHLITKNPQWILWSIDAVWRHRFNNVPNHIFPKLVSFPESFEIVGVKQRRDGFEGTVSAARQFCEFFTFFVEFSGEKWSRYSTYEVSAGLLAQW